MISDLDLIDITARLYDPAQRDYWSHLIDDPECYCAIKHLSADESAIVFRGSTTPLDWYNDLDEEPIYDPQLGPLHGGFFKGVRNRHQNIVSLLHSKVYVLGHSLGAARAFDEAGLLIANGIMPVAVRGWGCPRAGFATLSDVIAKCPSALWWRNRHDPVTYVPYRLGAFKHAGEARVVDIPGTFPDPWLFLAEHHLSLYRAGLVATGAQP